MRNAIQRPPIYIGDDAMMEDEELGLSNLGNPHKVMDDDIDITNVVFSPEEYEEMWNPWRKALILKLLGKSVSYRILEQRMREL